VLTYGYWQRQFGADPSVVGKTLNLNGAPFTVAGVADAGFAYLTPGKCARFFGGAVATAQSAGWLEVDAQPGGCRFVVDCECGEVEAGNLRACRGKPAHQHVRV